MLTPGAWQRLKGVLADVLDAPSDVRARALEEACGEDPELLRRAASFLGRDGALDCFLETPPDAPRTQMTPGARLGPYQVLARIGAGGMGEVYRARDPRLGRDVAVKVLAPELAGEPRRRARFVREARASSAVTDPHVVALYDIGVENGLPYLVTELVDGETLAATLARGRPETPRVVEWARQIAHGLEAAHSRGVVHRDLKPANLLVSSSGVLKIADFGLARLLEDESTALRDGGSAKTESGVILGTLGYMSPEQVHGRPADPRSDIFGFGCVLYEMLTGVRAFDGVSAASVMSAVLNENPPPPSRANTAVPPELDALVARCLEKLPENRYPTARELGLALDRLALPDRPRRPRPGRGRPRTLAVLPFANASGRPDVDYLSDGVTDGLIGLLSQVPGLRVVARATVFRYKGDPEAHPRRVGRDLGVEVVLTGSVARRDDAVEIAAELVETASGFRLWGDRYTRPALDVASVEDDVAREIWTRLRRTVPAGPRGRIERRHTRDREAHDLYLRALQHGNAGTAEGLARASALIDAALERDPRFALGWAAASQCLVWLGTDRFGGLPARAAYARAKAAARRAIALDAELAESHAALALSSLFDWEWTLAEEEFRAALRLDRGSVTARHHFGMLLMLLGRFTESAAHLRRALAVDPLSPFVLSDFGWSFYCARDYEAAAHYLRAALDVDPGFVAGLNWLALTYVAAGRPAEAMPLLDTALQRTNRAALPLAARARALAALGRREEVKAIARELEERSRREFIGAGPRATVAVALGDADEAFAWLGRALEARASFLCGLKVYPFLDPLREDPRFAALVAAVFGTAAR